MNPSGRGQASALKLLGIGGRSLKKHWISVLHLALILICPLAATLACQLVSLQDLPAAWDWLVSSPRPAAMYCMALLLAQMVLTGLTRLSGLAGLLAALPPFALTLASHYKAAINGEPLTLADLALADQLEDIAGFAAGNISITPVVWTAISYIAVPFVVLTVLDIRALLRRDHPLSFRRGLAMAAASGALLMLFIPFSLRPWCIDQYKAYPIQGARDPRLGVSLSLLSAWYCAEPSPSNAYSQGHLEDILEDMERALARQEPSELRPHIIFVMNESFFDITRLEGLDFSQDPLSNYHRLRRETTWGRFYTTTCGGGTGQVEMETFTGVASEELDGSTANTDLDPEDYQALPSYVRVLRENGYRTVAFHAHTDALYNRDQNYPHLGFDQVLFYDPFLEGATFEGGFFDDDSAADVIISLFEENRSQPLFLYTMTMQNHQPYRAGRYDPERVEVSSPLLSRRELEGVTSFTSGLYDADRMLGRLVDYFSRTDEPVILVFAGDHTPALPLGEDESVYTRLGAAPTVVSTGWTEEDYRTMMSTDYMIWSNCREPQGERVSGTTVMGASLLELAGVRSTPFFAWMAQTRRDTMAFHARLVTLDPEGQPVSPDSPAVRAFRNDYTDVIYDLLYGQGYIAGEINRVAPP